MMIPGITAIPFPHKSEPPAVTGPGVSPTKYLVYTTVARSFSILRRAVQENLFTALRRPAPRTPSRFFLQEI